MSSLKPMLLTSMKTYSREQFAKDVTAGIAVTIVIGQLKDFFGVTYPEGVKPIETMEKLHAFVENCGTVNLSAVIVGVVSLAILIISPYIFKKIPGSLLAVVAGILMVKSAPISQML